MAVNLTNSWLLLGEANGTPDNGTGDEVIMTTPNGKMVIVSGDANDVRIEVRGKLADGVFTDWVTVQDGVFTEAGARYIEGIDRAYGIRAVSAGLVIVQVFK